MKAKLTVTGNDIRSRLRELRTSFAQAEKIACAIREEIATLEDWLHSSESIQAAIERCVDGANGTESARPGIAELPPTLRGFDYPFIVLPKIVNLSGVYFLEGNGGQIMYVGQSVNIMARVAQHMTERQGQISRVFALLVGRARLNDTERFFINALNPPWNLARYNDPGVAPHLQDTA